MKKIIKMSLGIVILCLLFADVEYWPEIYYPTLKLITPDTGYVLSYSQAHVDAFMVPIFTVLTMILGVILAGYHYGFLSVWRGLRSDFGRFIVVWFGILCYFLISSSMVAAPIEMLILGSPLGNALMYFVSECGYTLFSWVFCSLLYVIAFYILLPKALHILFPYGNR